MHKTAYPLYMLSQKSAFRPFNLDENRMWDFNAVVLFYLFKNYFYKSKFPAADVVSVESWKHKIFHVFQMP